MTEKAEAKYAQLWAAYVLARAQRRDCLSRELPDDAEAFATQDLSAEDGPVEAHLSVLSAERKALKKLVKYARKHGPDVLPAAAPAVEPPAQSKPTATRAPRAKSAPAADPKVRARAKAGVSPAALATADVPPTPPARPRRAPAKAKPLRPRGPAGPAKP